MGSISPRLQRLYAAYKTDQPVPIIITTTQPPTPALTAALQAAGAGPIRGQSRLGNAIYTSATQATAEKLAMVPGVKEVAPDEPITAL